MTEQINKSKLNELQLLFLDEIAKYEKSVKNIQIDCEPVVTEKDYSYKVEIRLDYPESYAVTAYVDHWEITISFGCQYYNHHFTPDAEYEDSCGKTCDAAIAFVDGLLHGNCKLMISKANGKPYRWTFYRKCHDTWRHFSTGRIFWFNIFGHRSKEEIINR